MNTNTLGVLGLAKRAGRLVTGSANSVEAIRAGKAKLVIVACDASDNTKKLISDKSAFYKTESAVLDVTSNDLGHAVGAKGAIAAAAVTDSGFVTAVKKSLRPGEEHRQQRERDVTHGNNE